jgi:dienelactone hydrolase
MLSGDARKTRVLSASEEVAMRSRVFTSSWVVLFVACTGAAQGTPAERVVDLRASDGTPLKATYFPAAKPGPGVLLLHQCNRQRKVWDDLARHLADSGIHVLTLDYRGFGESGGARASELPAAEATATVRAKWPEDIDTALEYLVSQPGVTRDVIGAGGASCGVNQSIQLARRHQEVKSLVLLSGGTDRDGRQYLRQDSTTPILFSAADDDGGVVEMMQWLMSLTTNPGNDFVRYATGGHGVEMFAEHKELPAKIVAWFDTTLIDTPGQAPPSASAAALADTRPILATLDEPGGAAQISTLLAEARRKDPKVTLFPEAIVNQLGYERIQSGDTKGAIEIMQLNVTAYPASANAYDSLSDAYLADGQNELARRNAERALEVLASSTSESAERRDLIRASAQQKLKQLQARKP